jgi:hypothetical protein
MILAALLALSVSLAPVPADAQHEAKPPQPLCYAFWLDGDVYTNCEGHKEKVTQFADVESFAIDPNGQKLVLTRHQAKVQGRGVYHISDEKPHYYYSHSALQVILLSGNGGGTLSPLNWPMDLYATCGTVLGPSDVAELDSGPALFDDVLNGGEIRFDPYKNFRCSSDRKTVVGRTDLHDSALRIGLAPPETIAGTGGKHPIRYDVSSSGKYIAYNFPIQEAHNLCILATDTQKPICIDEAFWQKPISVSDTGEVLYETLNLGKCYYKGAYRVSTKDLPGYTPNNACQVVSYWRPGEAEPKIVESLGAQPQWISPETASVLIAWRARSQAAK